MTALCRTPAAAEIEKIVCPQCYAVLDVGDNFCRHCGRPLRAEKKGSGTVCGQHPKGLSEKRLPTPFSENRWVVLGLLLFVLGPLGLPMLWRSRQFSLPWKVVLTMLVLGITVAIVAMIWYVLHKAIEPLMQLRDLKGF